MDVSSQPISPSALLLRKEPLRGIQSCLDVMVNPYLNRPKCNLLSIPTQLYRFQIFIRSVLTFSAIFLISFYFGFSNDASNIRVVTMVKLRRMKWTEHVQRIGKKGMHIGVW
jgi:hypothetical protein